MIRLCVALFFGLFTVQAAAQCAPDRAAVIGSFGKATFQVDVADDDAERAQGLMHVENMPTMSGMLFVYPTPQHARFWMRNTLIGLDMIFAAPNGEILTIHENAVPLDETVIDGGAGVQFVLEINAGMAGRLGLKVGDTLQHPAILTAPKAPCKKS